MKTVLILGGSSDIGWALAETFQTNGYDLLLAARNTNWVEEKVKALPAKSNVSIIPFDARNTSDHSSWFSRLPVVPDVTICVFGYLGDQKKAETDWTEASTIIESNFTGAVSILNVVASAYEQRKKGVIVGVSSVAGERGRQSNYIYGSAKAGFTAYLSGLRNRLSKSSVHVLTVKPGFVDTKMIAGLATPKALTASPKQVSEKIFKGIKSGKNTIYVLPSWFLIMFVIRCIPEFIFKKLKL